MLFRKPDATAAEIAARVTKTAEYATAERNLAELRQAHEEAVGKLREAIGANSDHRQDDLVRRLDLEVKEIERKMTPIRSKLVDLREEHGARVVAAMASFREDAARQLLEILEAARQFADALDDSADEVERAHGRVARMPKEWVDDVTRIARRIADNPRSARR